MTRRQRAAQAERRYQRCRGWAQDLLRVLEQKRDVYTDRESVTTDWLAMAFAQGWTAATSAARRRGR